MNILAVMLNSFQHLFHFAAELSLALIEEVKTAKIVDNNNIKTENIEKKTKIENIKVLPAGVIPPNPSELLGSKKNKDLIQKLRKEFDLIILDITLPVLHIVTSKFSCSNKYFRPLIIASLSSTIKIDFIIFSFARLYHRL
jgi:MinD-like ATPase involved in chromosome partitioning or flagellar assembly